MSAEQWAAIMRGDESYAGSPSFLRFEAAVQEPHAVPPHHPDASGPRGRGDPVHLCSAARDASFPRNTHFDTTRGNIEATGAEAFDLVIAEGRDPQRCTRSRATWTSRSSKRSCASTAMRSPA